MKKTTLLVAILAAAGLSSGQAQDTWTQKADFGGGGRTDAVGFSIGSKGYIGTGTGGGGYLKDFWEYDPATNTWTQKADFGGIGRTEAVGFSIGTTGKGYVGTGITSFGSTLLSDFWEYNPVANTWTQKADFAGGARYHAAGFGIGTKGYIGTGYDFAGGPNNDFWEYNPSANTWTQMADFGGGLRYEAAAFSLGGKGYVGTGTNGSTLKDFWEYNPSADVWIQKADFGGGTRREATAFAIGSKGYIGTGASSGTLALRDFWQYDPSTDAWTQKADFGGVARYSGSGFSIGGKGYICIGTSDGGQGVLKDFWEYTPNGGGSTCDVPSSLSTSNVTDTSATLRWAAVSGAVEYQIHYKVVGATKWIVVRSTSNSKTLAGLTPATNYVWRVRTVCSRSPLVTSAYSGQVQFSTTAGTTCDFASKLGTAETESPSDACDTPTNLRAFDITPISAHVAWDAVDGAIGYEIKYHEIYPDHEPFNYVCTTNTDIELENLQDTAGYRYQVRAICSEAPLIVSRYSHPPAEFNTPPLEP